MSLSFDSWPTKIVIIAIIAFFQLLIENSTDFTFLHYRISYPFTLNLKQKRKEESNIDNFPYFNCYPNEKKKKLHKILTLLAFKTCPL